MPILSGPTGAPAGAPAGAGILRNQGVNPEATLGRFGLPYGMPRPGSPEALRMPYGAGVRPTTTGTGAVEGSGGTVARMLNPMTPRPTGGLGANPGTPPPAVMAQQVAPFGPVVRPASPVSPSPLTGAAPQPTPITAAPAPSGQPAGGTSGTTRAAAPAAAAPAPAASISPWYGQSAAAGAATVPTVNWWDFGGNTSGGGPAGPSEPADRGISVHDPNELSNDPNQGL